MEKSHILVLQNVEKTFIMQTKHVNKNLYVAFVH